MARHMIIAISVIGHVVQAGKIQGPQDIAPAIRSFGTHVLAQQSPPSNLHCGMLYAASQMPLPTLDAPPAGTTSGHGPVKPAQSQLASRCARTIVTRQASLAKSSWCGMWLTRTPLLLLPEWQTHNGAQPISSYGGSSPEKLALAMVSLTPHTGLGSVFAGCKHSKPNQLHVASGKAQHLQPGACGHEQHA